MFYLVILMELLVLSVLAPPSSQVRTQLSLRAGAQSCSFWFPVLLQSLSPQGLCSGNLLTGAELLPLNGGCFRFSLFEFGFF